jgi:hypothetical protein
MVMGDQGKHLDERIADCRRTGMLCLFISLFMYIGTVIPDMLVEPWKIEVLMITSFSFLLASVFFYWRTTKLKEEQMDDQ